MHRDHGCPAVGMFEENVATSLAGLLESGLDQGSDKFLPCGSG